MDGLGPIDFAASNRSLSSAIPAALQLTGITKAFGGKRAVDGLNLCVNPGEFYALLTLSTMGLMMMGSAGGLLTIT